MMNFNSLKTAQAQASENQHEKEGSFDEILASAKASFSRYLKSKDKTELKKASHDFFKAMNIKRNRFEPYFYISTIYFLFDKKPDAVRYFKLAEEVEPSNHLLVKLRGLVFS
jgi:hypothetical protein